METNTKILAAEFQYLKAADLEEALTWLKEYGAKAKVIAGGTDLLVKMKAGHIQPEYIIDIKGIEELSHVEAAADVLRIGAAATLNRIESDQLIKTCYSALYEGVRSMAARAVKNMGTIGGNLVNASPAADTAPPLLVFDSVLRISSLAEQKSVPVAEFFTGPGQSVLKPEELLTGIVIPKLGPDTGSSFLKLGRVAMDIAKINVAVCLQRSGQTCIKCRIAFGSVAPTPVRIPEAEALLENKEINAGLFTAAAAAAADSIKPIDDIRSTKAYRLKVSRVILEEALRAAWLRSGGEL